MINIKELKEKNELWIIEHIEKFNVLCSLIDNQESKFKLLQTISVLENELIIREGISKKEILNAE